MNKVLGCLTFALTPMLAGCASHQYVHWEDNWQEASRRAAEVTQNHYATITLTTGEAFKAGSLSFTRDSLSWTMPGSEGAATRRILALVDIDTVSVVRGNRAGLGAAVGAIAGASYVGLRCASDLICGQEYTPMSIGWAAAYGLIGSFFGLVTGRLIPQWLHLVP